VELHGLTMNAAINQLISSITPNDPYIAAIRAAQNRPGVVRLVLELKQAIAPQVFTLRPIADYQYRLVLDLYPRIAQDPLLALIDGMDDKDPLADILETLAQDHAPIPSVAGQQLPKEPAAASGVASGATSGSPPRAPAAPSPPAAASKWAECSKPMPAPKKWGQ